MTDRRPRILCVDDEPLVLEALSDTLRRDFNVTIAAGGRAGLQALSEKGPFAVVVSDFMMSGMNGAEFLSYARVAAPDTVRILLTGQASLENVMAVVNEGNIFRFLTKPCAHRDLTRALGAAVEQARVITADRVLMEGKLAEMSGHLLRVERLASLGTLAGAVGHEIKNALTPLAVAVDLIEEDVAGGRPPSVADLKLLRQAQERLDVHACNLLHLGRPTGDIHQALVTDLRTVVNDVVSMLRAAGSLSHVEVRLELSATPIVVAVGRMELEQVLMNIVKNAVEALAERRSPKARIEIRAGMAPTGCDGTCTVTDNAGGIPSASLPLLFDAYYTTKPPDRGTGLGLFVVRQIVEDNGGSVTVRSEFGHGTTFSLTFPLHAAGGTVGTSTGDAYVSSDVECRAP